METKRKPEALGLELSLNRPEQQDRLRIPVSSDQLEPVIYPELDADGDHIHFEMVPMSGDSLMWLTIRRGTTPEVTAASLRKIADLIERHGERLLNLPEGDEGSVDAHGNLATGPLRLGYDEKGNLCLPQ